MAVTTAQWTGPGSNGHYYQSTDSPMSWTDANVLATSMGGYLVSLLSQAENDFVQAQFFPVAADAFWIGLTDRAVEGTFVWTSGEPLVYTNWSGGEPNNYIGNLNGPQGEDYVVLNWSFSLGYDTTRGLWNDTPNLGCGTDCLPNPYRAIIEFDTTPVPEPEGWTGVVALMIGVGALRIRRNSRRYSPTAFHFSSVSRTGRTEH